MSILVTQIPLAAASATSQEVLVQIDEKICRPYCVNSSIQPSCSVAFSLGTVKTVGNYAVAPITATVTVVSPSTTGCGCAHTQVFSEQFELAFAGTTTNTVTIDAETTSLTEPANVTCCKARGVKLTTALTATIA